MHSPQLPIMLASHQLLLFDAILFDVDPEALTSHRSYLMSSWQERKLSMQHEYA